LSREWNQQLLHTRAHLFALIADRVTLFRKQLLLMQLVTQSFKVFRNVDGVRLGLALGE
jgi:hypothetical protein